MTKMLRIVSKKEGFRRCGVAHSTEPRDYPLNRFSKKERQALEAEPNLYVHEVDAKDEAAPEAESGDGKAAASKGPAKGGPGKNT